MFAWGEDQPLVGQRTQVCRVAHSDVGAMLRVGPA